MLYTDLVETAFIKEVYILAWEKSKSYCNDLFYTIISNKWGFAGERDQFYILGEISENNIEIR